MSQENSLAPLPDLPQLLYLEPCAEPHRFRSARHDPNINGRIFGGQVIAQALSAAAQTVPETARPHMMQLTFLRGASLDRPVDYVVEPLLDGRRYAMRHVRAVQGAVASIDAQVSFRHEADLGELHREDLSEPVPPPEALESMAQLDLRHREAFAKLGIQLGNRGTIEVRLVDPDSRLFKPAGNTMRYWIKTSSALPDSRRLHEAALAYLSDAYLCYSSFSARLSLVQIRKSYLASLNHAIWFHAPSFRADEWLLVESHSHFAGQGRGHSQARVYARDGRLVASLSQECLISDRV